MALIFANNTAGTVSSGGTTTSDTSWTVSATGYVFPTSLASGSYFHVVDPALPGEKIKVTAISGSGPYIWTVVRGDDGTTGLSHTGGFTVQQAVTAGDFGSFRQVFNVAPPTGTSATDAANIRAALSAANAVGGGTVVMQNGVYAGDTATLAVPQNVRLHFPQGAQLTVNCTAGSSVDAVTVDDGGSITGDGFGAGSQATGANIVGSATVNCRSLIANYNQTLQEFFYLSGIQVDCAGGGTYGTAVVAMVSCFVNSGIRDCVIICNSVNAGKPGLLISDASGSGGNGPVYVRDTWVVSSGGDGILITEGNSSGPPTEVWLDNVTSEHPASNYHNVHILGVYGGLANIKINGLHTENNNASTSTTAGVCIDGAPSNVFIRDYMALTGSTTNKVCVWLKNALARVRVENLANWNNMTPAIKDDTTPGGYNSDTTGAHVQVFNGPTSGNATNYFGPIQFAAGDLRFGSQSISLASTSVDARFGNIIDVAALAANVTVAAPGNPVANQMLIFKFVQNGTGGFTVSWNGAFRVASGVVSTTASKASVVAFRYDGSLSAWVQLWATTGV